MMLRRRTHLVDDPPRHQREVARVERNRRIGERGEQPVEHEVADAQRQALLSLGALHVDDVAVARAELEARGVEFNGETFDSGVCHMAFFTDPDGNDLMLHHRYAPYPSE